MTKNYLPRNCFFKGVKWGFSLWFQLFEIPGKVNMSKMYK